MKGINKAIIVGTLGKDPEVRSTQGGAQITTISVATSEYWKDKQTGEKKESTEWHRVVFFGKLAEIAGEHLTKGAKVYIEGKIKTRKWQDQSGQDRYSTEIVVDGFSGQLQMLGDNPDGGNQNNNNQGGSQQQRGSQQNQGGHQQGNQHQGQHQGQGGYYRQQSDGGVDETNPNFDDDIPF